MTSDQCRRLIDEAAKRNLVLMVDHTFVYMGAIRKIKEIVDAGELGKINYYDSIRVNLGLFQHDVNVIWDLAVHDLSIMDHVLGLKTRAVSATGMSHVPNTPENIAYITLFTDSDLIAHVNVNWLSPVKIRLTLIGGDEKMIVFDDLQPSEKVKVYDTGITVRDTPESIYKMLIDYRTGDMRAPNFDRTEALKVEALHFLDCLEQGKTPITDGQMGLRILNILEAASESIKRRGQIVTLD